MLTFSYAENDPEFERWSDNLLRTFIQSGRLKRVGPYEKPDALFVIVDTLKRNPHIIQSGVPLVLFSNEAWNNFYPPCGPDRFQIIVGCCPFPKAPEYFVQFPYYSVHFNESVDALLAKRQTLLKKPKTKFCCFVASNDFIGSLDGMFKRIDIFDRLNIQKRVDAAGYVRNNTGYYAPRENYLEWISDYKFMICLENTKANPEYLTEKPFQAWFAGTVPIYDGAYAHMMNRKSFVDASWNLEHIVEEVMRLDSDHSAYEDMRQTPLVDNIQEKFSLEEFETKFLTLISE